LALIDDANAVAYSVQNYSSDKDIRRHYSGLQYAIYYLRQGHDRPTAAKKAAVKLELLERLIEQGRKRPGGRSLPYSKNTL
jgi:hypothetical protein